MSKSLPIEFDDKSIEILKNVDSIHRNSLVNIALAAISKTHYYQTLTGNIPDDQETVASLDALDNLVEKKEVKEVAKASTTWDDFG